MRPEVFSFCVRAGISQDGRVILSSSSGGEPLIKVMRTRVSPVGTVSACLTTKRALIPSLASL